MTRRTDSADLRAIKTAIANDDIPGVGRMLQTMNQGELEAVAAEVRTARGSDLGTTRKLLLMLVRDQIERRKKENH